MSPFPGSYLRNGYTDPTARYGFGQPPSRSEDSSARPPGSTGTSVQDRVSLSLEALQVQKLAATDREVRAHEAAHAAVGGQHAGSASFSFKQGPDGKRYAIAGEVPIDLSAVADDPAATIQKAQTVRAAALAPADPSSQDLQVAAAATQLELTAKTELRQQQVEEASKADSKGSEPSGDDTNAAAATEDSASPASQVSRFSLYA